MGAFRGMQTADAQDPVRAVLADANELSGSGGALTGVVRDIDALIARMRWSGEDRIDFEKRWDSEVKPELERLAGIMRAKSGELTSLAARQARASHG
jgi:hypothetical protein